MSLRQFAKKTSEHLCLAFGQLRSPVLKVKIELRLTFMSNLNCCDDVYHPTNGKRTMPQNSYCRPSGQALCGQPSSSQPAMWHGAPVSSSIRVCQIQVQEEDMYRIKEHHYKELEEDISDIEAGLIPISGYTSTAFTLEWADTELGVESPGEFYTPRGKISKSARTLDQDRKKGVPWTEDEQRQFLLGLKK